MTKQTDIASMTREQLISALADISAENFSEEPENADQPAAIEYWRSLTTADLRAELEAARG